LTGFNLLRLEIKIEYGFILDFTIMIEP